MTESLAELQHWMRSEVTRLESESDAPEGIAVYRHAYFARLEDTLASDFEHTRWVLGSDAFRGLVCRYLEAHPPRSPNIGDVGRDLPAFLAEDPQGHELPFLPDLARLERLMTETVYLKRSPGLDTSLLASLRQDQWLSVRLRLDASVRIVRFDWPVISLMQIEKKDLNEAEPDELPRESTSEIGTFHRSAQGASTVERLDEFPFNVLKQISHGFNLGSLLESLPNELEVLRVQELLSRWIGNGLLHALAPIEELK